MSPPSAKSMEEGRTPSVQYGYGDPKTLEGEIEEHTATKRGLSSRQLQLLAIGGCIGTGLFVGTSTVLTQTGPAPLLMSYIVMASIVWFVMNVLGEMTTYLPIRGVSVPYLIGRFTEPSIGFASGYNYWYSFAMLLASEVTASGLIIEYWNPPVSVGLWIAIVLVESEFWFAGLKILAIIGLIILGVVLFFGGGPNHDRLGFRYWQDPGAFNPYLVPGDTGKFLGFWTALIKSGFSFIFSPELITTAAGEVEAPRRNIPKATKRFIYRVFTFYILGSLVIGVTVAYNDPTLEAGVESGGSGAGASPFVVAIQNAGIGGLNHVVNAAILISAWSSGNAWCYAGSRTLYSLAGEGQAPKIFTRTNRTGVPYVAVLATWTIGLLSFLNLSSSGQTVFYWFTNITTVGGFINWVLIGIAYLVCFPPSLHLNTPDQKQRFRKALQFHGMLDMLPFKTPLQPYGTYYVMFIISILTLTNGYAVFFPGRFTASDFLVSYIVFAIFLALYAGHKIWYRTPWLTKVSEVDIFTGKDEIDRLCENDMERQPRNWLERVWWWIF
ncbi:PUTX_EMENI Proline-specific permease (Proline transport protein) [Aspergillus nidulans FGSC A4]|uniref:proline permease prnB n=1 Tax=Emericella nidulans (strain FGSC A4 / ATCC 38163 / CBS 112.46 / NRRL 194 / M139) TaxID=227321 RepID=UPI0000235E75|nr:proline permease prnB [Aspergillus nidulans FGSC A4]EAA64018.1 PUTX_EMENI Proline-specific permease (Proline transport protein) [Aspergillus nidulans FGSC A4]CBF85456.1 TPA: Proline-specific permease (Proline transport protein) [Source:UniProtKB/Swiss-Prot;Acc:P18696] [Aspergillus nidulans FGSC A4]|eukprot:XP_659336.1 PUTX_EMENI Proline-specific permease (Proline transport protein) [Aspergillus nidulans FGSC A4]